MKSDRQAAHRVVEEPRHSLLPYIVAGAAAAVAAWSVWQPDADDFVSKANKSASPQVQARTTGPNSAQGEVRTVFSADDYPASAQRNGQEGTVQAMLTIDPHGRVSHCRIIRSSSVPSLDNATCSIIQRRARFIPARDAGGHAIQDTVKTPPIVWRLEG